MRQTQCAKIHFFFELPIKSAIIIVFFMTSALLFGIRMVWDYSSWLPCGPEVTPI